MMQFLTVALLLILTACATLPSDDIQAAVQERALQLTAKWNAHAGTNYDCPSIEWADGPCSSDQDVEGAGGIYQQNTIDPISHSKTTKIYFENTITLTTACAITNPDELINNTLPHELAHNFAYMLYGVDEGHNELWQDIAVFLGVPRTDPYITDPTIRAGGT